MDLNDKYDKYIVEIAKVTRDFAEIYGNNDVGLLLKDSTKVFLFILGGMYGASTIPSGDEKNLPNVKKKMEEYFDLGFKQGRDA